MTKNVRFEDQNNNWEIWKKNSSIERSTKRVVGKLPEMEATKQLVKILKKVYRPEYSILDFGCAAGHYLKALKRLNKNINYTGFDITPSYIKFAKKYFKEDQNASFDVQSVFKMNKKYNKKFDIVFCANVLHHLPSIDVPLKNLLLATKKICIIRTLISDNTHLSRFYYDDSTDKKGFLNNFQFQNTYSYSLFKKKISKYGKFKVKFIKDEYDGAKINKEFTTKERKKYPGLTKYLQGTQIAGSKVFEFNWAIITK